MQEERVVVGGGVALAVRRWEPAVGAPAGPAFLLVHGLASNARLWDAVAASLTVLGDSAVAVDLRGHGRSDKPDEGYDFATITQDLRGLLDALAIPRAIAVGQSWGADVVLELAVRFPQRVVGVACVDGGINDLGARFPDWDECARRLAPPPLAGRPANEIEAGIRARHPDWSEAAIEATLANFEVRGDGTVAPRLTYERHMRILRALWEHRPEEAWSRLRAPALVCPADTGDAGWSAEKRAAAERVQALHPGTRVRWFAGDHDIHAQHPDELAALLHTAVTDGFLS